MINSTSYLRILLAEIEQFPSLWWIKHKQYNDVERNEKRWKIVQMIMQDKLSDESIEVNDMKTTLFNTKRTIAHCKATRNPAVLGRLEYYRWMVHSKEVPKDRDVMCQESLLINFMNFRKSGHVVLNLTFLLFCLSLLIGGFFSEASVNTRINLPLVVWLFYTMLAFFLRLQYIESEHVQEDCVYSFAPDFGLALLPKLSFILIALMFYKCTYSADKEFGLCFTDEYWSIHPQWFLPIALIGISKAQMTIHSRKRILPPPKTKYIGLLISETIIALMLTSIAFFYGISYLFFPIWFVANYTYANYTYYQLWKNKSTFFPHFTNVPFTMKTLHCNYAIDFVQKDEEYQEAV